MEGTLMMFKRIGLFSFLFTCFLFCQVSVAATTLFDPNRGQSVASKVPKKTPRVNPVRKTTTPIQYRLVGVSLLLSTYQLIFQETGSKKYKKIKWNEVIKEAESPITNFLIKAVENRRVILQASKQGKYVCQEDRINKITCLKDQKQIIFDLVTSKPIQTAQKQINKLKPDRKKKLLHKKSSANKPSSKNPFNPFIKQSM